MFKLLLLIAFLGLSSAANYEGFKVYKVTPRTNKDSELLHQFQNNDDFDFWSKPNKVLNPVTLAASPKVQFLFENILKTQQIPYEILIKNLEANIQEEQKVLKALPRSTRGIGFDQYYRHDEINAYLDELQSKYPELVTVSTIGKSYEGRPMNQIRISPDSVTNTSRPVIFVDGGIHAREWIAPALALYVINQLVENSGKNSNLLQNVDWVVLPVVNPDGYEYTFTDDRLWRKTRSPGQSNARCAGADPNRNFGFHWAESGASSNECSETFAGSKAFSEIEAQNLRDILANTENVVAYLTLHSYGQYILYPWGYSDELCDNWQELDTLGNDVNEVIRAIRGTDYTVGSSTRVLYEAAGASDDWAKSTDVDVVYTIELPGGGWNGFDLPPSEIKPVVEETFEGLKVIHKYIENKYTQ